MTTPFLRVSFAALTLALSYVVMTQAEAPFKSLESLKKVTDKNGKITARNIELATGWTHLRAFNWSIEAADTATGEFVRCSPRRVFHTGDRFRLRVAAANDLYCYVLVKNADGTEELLLPAQEGRLPKLEAGKELLLPEKGGFEFKAPAAREELWIVAAPMPLPFVAPKEIWQHLRKLQSGEGLNQQEEDALANLKGVRAKGLNDALEETRKRLVRKDLDSLLGDFQSGARKRGVELVASAPQGDVQLVVHGAARPDPSIPVIEIIVLEHQN